MDKGGETVKYTKRKWELPCGCSIFLESDSPPLLTYCPKHKAALDMYEALKQMLKDWHSGEIEIHHATRGRVEQALATEAAAALGN